MLRHLLERLSKRAETLAARSDDTDPLDELEQRLDVVDVEGARQVLESLGHTASSSRLDILRGRLAMMEQRYDDAEKLLADVVLFEPRNPEGLAWMAALKMCQQSPEEAIRLAEQAQCLGYHRAWLLEMSGVAHFAANRIEQAAAAWTAGLCLEPDRRQTRANLIKALGKLHRWSELESYLTAAIADEGETATYLAYLGNCLVANKREAEAWPVFARAAARHDVDATVLLNQAVALFNAGQIELARQTAKRGIELDPSMDILAVMLSNMDLIQKGSTREHWQAYERRFGVSTDNYRVQTRPWFGERLPDDQILLVYAEQGIGDVILFARWLPRIAELAGCRVNFGVRAPLERLIRQTSENLPGWQNISVFGVPRPEGVACSAELPLMSLLAKVDLPIERTMSPYVTTNFELDEEWAARLPRTGRRRVGLVWAGNPARPDDSIRSIPTAQLECLRDEELLQRVEFVNLVMDERSDCKPSAMPFEMTNVRVDIKDFADTAALIKQLDLVVAIDCGVAHLAGAVGTPCWVLLSTMEDWRWRMNGVDQPWYGRHRSLRANRNRDWSDVLSRLKDDLLKWSQPGGTHS